MSYLLTLDELNSARLEALAEKERVPAPRLIERIVGGYLNSLAGSSQTDRNEGMGFDFKADGLNGLFKWNLERGTIGLGPFETRIFVFNSGAWDAVERYLFFNLLTGAAVLLSEMGNAYGRATALDYRSSTDDPENFASYFERLSLAGWGRFSISGDFKNGPKITIRVQDCAFCKGRNTSLNRGDPCSFLMGVCKGIADTVLDSSHACYETKCISKGYDLCEIVIRRNG